MAGQGHVDLEAEFTVQGFDGLDHVGLDLGLVTTGPQQGQHQRGELVAQRQTRKAHALGFALTRNDERRLARIVARGVQRDLVRQRNDVVQQTTHLGAGIAVIQRSDQPDRLAQHAEVGLQLGFEGGVKHGGLLKRKMRCGRPLVHGPASKPMRQRYCLKKWLNEVPSPRTPRNRLCRAASVVPLGGRRATRRGAGGFRSSRPVPGKERSSSRLRSTWPGTPGRGWRRCTGRPSACAGFP
ncbi:hypothetical protein Y695_01937 [Hydrogenophaga sp. T4]|nr:hypothetical protein Y695_01937 [Hydrogenophaga sp. T4]